jgi:Flp pilus assembly protein TadG
MKRTNGITCQRRAGAVAVEFALTAPLLFLMLFGSLEMGHANMVFNATEAACYEGARQGIIPGATAAQCTAAANRLLQISGIRDATVEVTPNDLNVTTDTVAVRIRVPYNRNTIVTPVYTNALVIDRRCELVRERL